MRGRRRYRNLRKRHTGRRSLRTEQLEKRELLAADFFGAGAAMGAAGNDGVCQADSEFVEVGTCAPQANASGGMSRARGGGPAGPQQPDLVDVPTRGELSELEEEGLLKLREEEKLARDVYLALAEQWGVALFTNIAESESRHMDAVGRLIENYGLEDPVGNNGEGVFTNPEFSTFYNDLITDGPVSVVEAYKVGAMIEEMDIVDLQYVLDVSDNEDINRVFENLMRGSRNHLRAFAAEIEAASETYEAQFLTQEEFNVIAAEPMERGNGRGGQDRSGRMRGGTQADDVSEPTRLRGRSSSDTPTRNRLHTLQDDPASDILQTRAHDRLFANLGSGRGLRRF